MQPIPTLEWTGNALRLLDQRLLPGREEYVCCGDVESLADAIRNLAVRGAPAIGIAAAYGCVLAALTTPEGGDFGKIFLEKVALLESTRPTAVNLFHCTGVQRRIFEGVGDRDELIRALLRSAHDMVEKDLAASMSMGKHGAGLLPGNCTVLTHCNAGGLATAGLGTALAVVYEAWDAGKLVKVFADETRPLFQGSRLTAWELEKAGIPVSVLPDSAAASLLASGSVDAVVVGSDRIAANGDVANKVGTYPLALAARAHDVPFYVVAPLSTFDMETESGKDIVIEFRGRGEMACLGGRKLVPDGVDAWNPAFDVTPSDLVDAIICEKGVIRYPNEDSVREFTGMVDEFGGQ